MLKRIPLLLLCFAMTHCFSQRYIGVKRNKARRWLNQYVKEQKIESAFLETDTSLVLRFRDPKFKAADFIYHFDGNGRCDTEISTSSCDSCVDKYWRYAFNRKGCDWQQVQTAAYVTAKPQPMMLERFVFEGQPAIRVKRVELVRRVRQRLN
jgi:hypothetical protein